MSTKGKKTNENKHEAFRVVNKMFAISLCPFVSPFLGHDFSSLEVTSPLVCNGHFLYSLCLTTEVCVFPECQL